MRNDTLTVVVPTLNEEGNVQELIRRLDQSLSGAGVLYEVIIIDDHSTDGTLEKLNALVNQYPLRVFAKQGARGKAQSLLEGFSYAKYDRVAFIDADLQYPPEALPGMLDKLHHGFDIIVADRRLSPETAWHRALISRVFHFFFSRLLHNLDVDTQAGLKLFKTRILKEVTVDPSPWAFDLEFLLNARNYGYVIGNFPILFAERRFGQSKLNVFRATFEIGWNALKMRFKRRAPLLIHQTEEKMRGAGVAHFGQRFITHTTLHHHSSALHTFATWQKHLIIGLAVIIVAGFFVNPLATGIIIVVFLSVFYLGDALFNLFLVMKSLKKPPEIESSLEELRSINDSTLPMYSVLCPLYKEAQMLPAFVGAIEKLDWPKEKLDVLLLLEENDQETIAAAQAMDLPSYIKIVIVPHSMPKTKPKACNYGLSFASGEYIVIYDAEDIPDPLQLKKAFLGFQKAGPSVRCLQAKLNYFNPHQNLLTKLFTAEYSLWFDVVLPGLQSINTSIPLGGTSNHFRTQDLLELEGWDPFNVTEDCDLGVRIFKRGYRTAIIDSVTLEEANSDIKNWLRQRSRWIKGYMQTYLVHMRHPVQFFRENGWHALIFQLVVGGKIAFMFINPFLWTMTLSYFLLYAFVGPTIEKLYPPAIFYIAVASLIFGNFLYLYYYMIGAVKREHYSVIKYVFLVPFYWVMISTAALIALYELLVKPHYWQKTHHGLHTNQKPLESAFASLDAVPLTHQTYHFTFHRNKTLTRIKTMVPATLWNFLFSSKGFFMGALVFSNFLNFLFNAFLGRMLSFEELSLVTLINTLWFLVIVVVGAFSATINHRTAYLVTAESPAHAVAFLRKSLRQAIQISLFLSAVWLLLTPFLSHFFRITNIHTLIFFTPVFAFSVIAAGYRGFLQGSYHFMAVAGLYVGESLVKLVLAAIFIWFGFSTWVYLVIPLSIAATAGLAFGIASWLAREHFVRNRAKPEVFPKPFFSAILLSNLSSVTFLSVDILLVNHYLTPVQAGQYALLALVGKMIFFLGSLPDAFTITFVSRREGLKLKTEKIFSFIYALVFAIVLCGVIILGVFGSYTIPFLFGDKATAILGWLLPYTGALALFTLTGVMVSYHLAKHHYSFSVVSFLLSLGLVGGIMTSHKSVDDIVRVVLMVSVVGWVSIQSLHLFYHKLRFVRRGFRDLFGIFVNGLPKPEPLSFAGKRILIFNWRDTKHSFAGGAEVYVHEIAKRWVREGHHVAIFSGSDGKQARHEIIDGVDIVRRGGFHLVYAWAVLYYMFRFRGNYDVIVDCENGIPFFTPLYVRKPIFCLMHHVHQNVFFHSLSKPLAWLASTLEKDLMPLVYRNVKFITVSESSKEEMETIGLGKAGILVVHPGIDRQEFSSVLSSKTLCPTILYLGRLKGYKSVNVLIQAFRIVLAERPEAKLIIAGDGEEKKNLMRLASELHLSEDQIQFVGWVSDEKKIELLQSAWMLVNPSFMEGWGIVAIEASACGTPVIASDVPGLRDSVRDTNTGYLVPYGDVKGFAEKILLIIQSKELREGMENESRVWAGNFDWGKTSESFLAYISEINK